MEQRIRRKEGVLMALRTTCLCDGKVIGIESIFTVIDGKQINIRGKVEALRVRSRNNELFCPCGCGANLTLVAGDKNLREQHFRLKRGQSDQECQVISEGETSIYSKIVLKCWLDEKLNAPRVETRVPICDVDDSDRKYEMSFFVPDRKLAVSYCNNRANLSDEKLSILDANSEGIKLVYITDISNTGNSPQYPEMMMKVQKRQGFCLFLQLHYENGKCVPDYSQAELKAFFYLQTADGTWVETQIAEGKLRDFDIDTEGQLSVRGQSLCQLKSEKERDFRVDQERKREKQEKVYAEWTTQCANERQTQMQTERETFGITRKTTAHKISQSIKVPLYDLIGQRRIQCVACGLVGTTDKFVIYGGEHRENEGICKECQKKGLLDLFHKDDSAPTKQTEAGTNNPMCPICGGKLKERYGRYGRFYGCTNFPACQFTSKVYR